MLECKIESPKADDGEFDYYWNNLVIYHNKNAIATHADHCEPEDNSFHRDLKWIAPAIENAYGLGYNDALNDLEKACALLITPTNRPIVETHP